MEYMNIDFKYENLNTIIVIRDINCKIIKTSKQVPDTFFVTVPLDNNLIYEVAANRYWKKYKNVVVIDDCEYYQEEYINVTDLILENAKLLRQLRKDPLTKLDNITAVAEKQKEMETSNKGYVIAMIDINDFKIINDKYGHCSGDRALVSISKLFKTQIRNDNDSVARIGGDEFLCIFATNDADAIIEKLRVIHEQAIELGKKEGIPLSISTGITLALPGDSFDDKRKEADQALYYAKNNNKGSIGYYDLMEKTFKLYEIEEKKPFVKKIDF